MCAEPGAARRVDMEPTVTYVSTEVSRINVTYVMNPDSGHDDDSADTRASVQYIRRPFGGASIRVGRHGQDCSDVHASKEPLSPESGLPAF
jgi:hypothetical protein